MVAEPARGWFGEPGILVARNGSTLSPCFKDLHTTLTNERAQFLTTDADNALQLDLTAVLDASGVLVLVAAITNLAEQPLYVNALNLTVAVPAHLNEVIQLGGRHAMEFQEERSKWGRSVVSVASRRGRTSHQQSPTVFCVDQTTSETHGDVFAMHLAWSGNFKFSCDSVTADVRSVTAGEILEFGEIVLAKDECYSTPNLLVTASHNGIANTSRQFHNYLRSATPKMSTPRPVIINTWEAVYFDHDTERLFELARRGAQVGAERFVLDDGWFRGRRDDTAGLGDWEVDPNIWPDGLQPLADHVRTLGMEFGIWFEPEMVNPNSDLYRQHPDWVHGTPHQHTLTGRNQLVLNLGLVEVRNYLVEAISALLSQVPISHVKWDHNRDLVGAGAHNQTQGFYELLTRLRKAHPKIQFESCASGGGRIDAGVAAHVVRFWTSDSIDALDRLSIQRGALRVIPPEMLGAHIGAPLCHTTGRRHPLSFRALSALPFWLGIEWDLLSADDHELRRLSEVVAVHKRFRNLFHSGTTAFSDHPDPNVHIHSVITADLSEGVAVIATMGNGSRHLNAPARIFGLAPEALYRCDVVSLGSQKWALNRGVPTWLESGLTATGSQLATIGLPFPPLLPQSGILVHMERV
jgi:alpha-galactosidase